MLGRLVYYSDSIDGLDYEAKAPTKIIIAPNDSVTLNYILLDEHEFVIAKSIVQFYLIKNDLGWRWPVE